MRLTPFLDFGTIGLCFVVFFLLWLFTARERYRQNTTRQMLLRTAIILTALSFLLTSLNISINIFQHNENQTSLDKITGNSIKKKHELLQKITMLEDRLKTIEDEKDALTTHRDALRETVMQFREDIAKIRQSIASLATHKVAKTSVSLPSDFSPQEAHVKVRFPKDEEIKNQLLEKTDMIIDRFNKVLD
ncbi:MAG: hypothetical protein FJ264_15505 [Planctomycetes bacterium]|nr:hypothetical protein [Planctomycetota bacterium]